MIWGYNNIVLRRLHEIYTSCFEPKYFPFLSTEYSVLSIFILIPILHDLPITCLNA